MRKLFLTLLFSFSLWGQISSYPGTGGGGTSVINVSVTHTFTGTQELAFTHNLSTTTPIVNCYNSSTVGVSVGLNVTTPATTSITYVTATDATLTCVFNASGSGIGPEGPAGATGPAGSSTPFTVSGGTPGAINTALAGMATGGTLYISTDVSGAVAINVPSNTTIECLPGVILTGTSTSNDIFALNGVSYASIKNCRMTGGQNGIHAYGGTDKLLFQGNFIFNYSSHGIFTDGNSFNLRVVNNYIQDGAIGSDDPIFVQDHNLNALIEGNIAINGVNGGANSHGIAVHTSVGGGEAGGTVVLNNWIYNSGPNFGIEIGAFNSGNRIYGCIVQDNHIIQRAVTNGGISLDTTQDCKVVDNDVDLASFNPLIGGIEIVVSPHTVVSGNHVRNNTADHYGFSGNRMSYGRVTDNYFHGLSILENSGSVVDMSYNIFKGNVFEEPAASTGQYIFTVKCNFASCTSNYNLFAENTFVGINVGSSYAILLEEDAGTIDSNILTNNIITGVTTNYLPGNGVTNTMYGQGQTSLGLTFTGSQFIPTGTAPTIAVGAAAGSSPGTPTVTGYNAAGIVTVITGTATTTGTLATVTFNGTLGSAPQGCRLTPRNSAAAAQAGVIFTGAPSTTTWTIGVGAAAVAISTTYIWSYECI